MTRKNEEQKAVQEMLSSYGAVVTAIRRRGKEVVHSYHFPDNPSETFHYAHGVSRGGNPRKHFRTGLQQGHRRECHRRGLTPRF